MKVVVVGDVHCHNWDAWAHILPNGRNSRLQCAIDCLNQAAELAEGGVLAINGDLFHDRQNLSIDVMDAIIDTVLTVSTSLSSVIISVGNHDQFRRNGSIHSLRAFEGRSHIEVVPLDGNTYVINEGETILFAFPFTTDLAKCRQFIAASAERMQGSTCGALLMLHQPVVSAKLGGGKMSEHGLVESDLDAKCWNAVLLGHFHKPQQLFGKNVFYVGSPYQIDASEAGDQKRFMVWDGKARKLISVPVVGMPEFRRMNVIDYDAHVMFNPAQAAIDFIELEVYDLEEARKLNLPSNVVPVLQTAQQASDQIIEQSSFDVKTAFPPWLESRKALHLVDRALSRLE